MSSYSKEITNGIKQYMENNYEGKFSFEEDEDFAAFYFGFSLEESKLEKYNFKVIIRRNYTDLIGTLLPGVEEGKRAAVSEYVHRVNHCLRYGNFEFSPSEGKVRFKNSMCCIGMEPTQSMIADLFNITTITMFRYEEPLLKLLAGEMKVEEAVREGENRIL
jgi:hypothetical protein